MFGSVSSTVNMGENFCDFWKLSAKIDAQPKFAAVGRLKSNLPLVTTWRIFSKD